MVQRSIRCCSASRADPARSFVALYGIKETRDLIAKALNGELVLEHEAFKQERAA